jgi:hypothetical protein
MFPGPAVWIALLENRALRRIFERGGKKCQEVRVTA